MTTENCSLDGHTITSVDVFDLETRYPRTVGRNAVRGSHGPGPRADAVVLRTSSGATGWGLLGAGNCNFDQIIGSPVEQLFDPAIGVTDSSIAWADFALHDLAGVLTGQSVHTMLGARGVSRVPTYDGSIYFDDLDPENNPRGIDAVLANVQDGWDDGYRAFKLKIGRGFTWMPEGAGFERDVEVTRAVRDAFPSAELLVDGNNGFTVEGMIRYLDRVSDVGLFWVEEPFHEHQNGLERLKSWLNENGSETLIADGEYLPDIEDVVRYAREGLIDVLLMDVISHGLTPWRRLSSTLQGSQVRISPHAWALPIKTLYAAQMAAGLGGVITVEGVRGETLGVDTSGYVLADGLVTVPDSPGFGIPAPIL